MIDPPPPLTLAEHRARVGDVGTWEPYVVEVLRRHGLESDGAELRPGFNPTYPTFVVGEYVVKLFGPPRAWRRTYPAERAAHRLVATAPGIRAPALVAEGRLFEGSDASWPYLVTTRARGTSLRDASLTGAERRAIAADLGLHVKHVHALPPSPGVPRVDGTGLDLVAAARRSSLPPHLIAGIPDYVARPDTYEPVFVHGDLVAAHVFVEGGRVVGLIDWGDAGVADRHLEVIQVYRDVFACDGALLRVFLEASEWPVAADFPRRALVQALYRQATGLRQHGRMDVFEPVAERFPLAEVRTLQDLADLLFAG